MAHRHQQAPRSPQADGQTAEQVNGSKAAPAANDKITITGAS
jgi:hypothetical protein